MPAAASDAPTTASTVAAPQRDMPRQVLTWMVAVLLAAAIILLAVSIVRERSAAALDYRDIPRLIAKS